MEKIQTSGKIFVGRIDDTKLAHRPDLFDWVCSEEVKRGRVTDRYWIMDASISIFNTYNDPDVNFLINLLARTHTNGYSSLMIMKHGTDYRPNSSTETTEEQSGQGESQQTHPPETGAVSDGEPNVEVPSSASGSGHSE